MKIFPTVRRVVAAAAGTGAGFIASQVKVGWKTTLELRLIGSTVNAGVKTEQSPITFRGDPIEPGIAQILIGATGSVQESINQAVAHSSAPGNLGITHTQLPAIFTVPSLRSAVISEIIKPGFAAVLNGITGTLAQLESKAAFVHTFSPFVARVQEFKPAFMHSIAISTLQVKEQFKPALLHSMSPSSVRVKEEVKSATVHTMAPGTLQVMEQEKPAVEIIQIKYDLTRRVGAATVTEYAVLGRTDFIDSSVGNALGVNDGTLATCNSDAIAARSGGLRLEYANHIDKSALTITSVKLHFYTRMNSFATGGTLRHQWRIGTGAWIILATRTVSATQTWNFLTTPDTFDITASITSWANLDDLEASVEVETPSLGPSGVVDAVELEILATVTQTV